MTDANVPWDGSASRSTSISLIEQARANDRASWERIVYLYSPLVYTWCRRFGLQEADTLDVGQDVLQLVFKNLSRFRKDRPGDSFRKWLKTITRNRVVDVLRRNGREPKALGGSEGIDALAEPALCEDSDDGPAEQESEHKIVLRRALDMVRQEFEPRTWDAFWRVTIDETPVDEVARALGVSTNVVYLSKSRVIRRLSDLFAELIEV